MKKILVISVLALVLIACVAAAGCTSTSQTTVTPAPTQTPSDPITGAWYLAGTAAPQGTIDQGMYFLKLDVTADGKGTATYYLAAKKDDGTYGASTTNSIKQFFTWTKNTDKSYTLAFPDGVNVPFTYDAEKKTISSNFGTYVKGA